MSPVWNPNGPIKPALDDEQWDAILCGADTDVAVSRENMLSLDKQGKDPRLFVQYEREGISVEQDALPAIIAVANEALPVDSPHKLIHAHLKAIKMARENMMSGWLSDTLRSAAIAIESILPPEER